MILYHVVSTYQLLSFMEHRLLFHPEEESVLMIADSLTEKYPQYKKLEEFFDDIIVFAIRPKFSKNISIQRTVCDYFDKLLNEHNYSLQEFEEIYVACAHFYFGFYMVYKKREFIFFEDCAGIISRPHVLESIESKRYPVKSKFAVDHGLYDGTSIYAKERICDKNAQLQPFDENRVEHFDTVRTLVEMPKKLQERIRDFFIGDINISIDADAAVVLTQHFSSLGTLSFEEHCLIYQLLIDYFLEDKKVVFKIHPDDIVYYSYLFPECSLITQKFPSEFLPIIFTERPKYMATISSTAINNLKDYFEHSISFEQQYQFDFPFTHRYYIALKYAEKLADKKRVFCLGTNNILIKNLQKYSDIRICESIESVDDFAEVETGNVLIIDYWPWEKYQNLLDFMECASEEDVLIFINTKEDYSFYDIEYKHIFDFLNPICIKKNRIGDNEDFYADCEEEYIYVYSKNKEYLEMSKKNIQKKLKHTQLEISVKQFSEQQQEIEVLKGILRATEKRLLRYIKREKELEEELGKYKV